MPFPGRRPWGDDEFLLIELWGAGVSVERLAEQFDRTPRAVVVKLRARGLWKYKTTKRMDHVKPHIYQDGRFCNAMAKAGYRQYVSKEPGTERPQPIAPETHIPRNSPIADL